MAHADVYPDELRRRLGDGEDVFVLDVREDDEVAGWAFPGAHHIPLGQLAERAAELPTDRQIVVICHSGVRSASAADALDRGGLTAANLVGGVVGWVDTEPA